MNNRILLYSDGLYQYSMSEWISGHYRHKTNAVFCSPDEINDFPLTVLKILNINEAFLKNKIYTLLTMSEYDYGVYYSRNFYIEFENEKDALAFKLRI